MPPEPSFKAKTAASICDLFARMGILEALGLSVPLPIAKGGTSSTTSLAARLAMKLASVVVASGTTAINWQLGDSFDETLVADKTYTFTNVADGLSIQFVVGNPVGDFLPTFPVNIKWPNGDAQPPAVAPDTKTLFSFTSINGVIYGAYVEGYSLS